MCGERADGMPTGPSTRLRTDRRAGRRHGIRTAATVSKSLSGAVAGLPVATEIRTGYDRGPFPHRIDADGDRRNSRYEVLIAEATTTPTAGSGRTLSGGRWYSYYDGAYRTLPADLDVDHPVPLAEALDSGART